MASDDSLEELFQSVGNKLGWFADGNVQKLVQKSASKKKARPRKNLTTKSNSQENRQACDDLASSGKDARRHFQERHPLEQVNANSPLPTASVNQQSINAPHKLTFENTTSVVAPSQGTTSSNSVANLAGMESTSSLDSVEKLFTSLENILPPPGRLSASPRAPPKSQGRCLPLVTWRQAPRTSSASSLGRGDNSCLSSPTDTLSPTADVSGTEPQPINPLPDNSVHEADGPSETEQRRLFVLEDDSLPGFDCSARDPTPQTERAAARCLSSSSGDDGLDLFLDRLKTPCEKPRHQQVIRRRETSLDDFIVSDSEEVRDGCSSSDDSVFYVKTTRAMNASREQSQRRTVRKRQGLMIGRRTYDDDDSSTGGTKSEEIEAPLRRWHATSDSARGGQPVRCSFLKSLDCNLSSESVRDPDSVGFVTNFKKTREALASRLFKLYDDTIFDHKLKDVPVTWNTRLLKTAGLCSYKENADKESRSASIELSVKVVDSAERLRDTLVHEMCHAATWLVSGVRDGHGHIWRMWAQVAVTANPDLPPIQRCHTYEIATKYIYRCAQCSYEIGRHSKSLDIERKVCGKCRGKFVLLVNGKLGTATPSRTPGKFAIFVKENYGSIKKNGNIKSHAEVMRSLGEAFSGRLTLD